MGCKWNRFLSSSDELIFSCFEVFGYNPKYGFTAGEFGHNDFYPVVIAACQQKKLDGRTAIRAMVLLDEIRGRLAEVFSLKSYKIDHVVHGAIASAAVY